MGARPRPAVRGCSTHTLNSTDVGPFPRKGLAVVIGNYVCSGLSAQVYESGPGTGQFQGYSAGWASFKYKHASHLTQPEWGGKRSGFQPPQGLEA